MRVGPVARTQLTRLARTWKQGEHLLISGSTGSGKTALARHVDQIRIDAGGHVMVMVCKMRPDRTILEEYKGWVRWKAFKTHPSPGENRILLWPDTSKAKTLREAREIQRTVFADALNGLGRVGKWTLHIDEGLYVCAPSFLNLQDEIGMLHAQGRSSNITIVTLTQRPSHLPLIVYSSASHAMIGRARETVDVKRLSELGGRESAKGLSGMIDRQGRHDFLWIPVATDEPPETINLQK